MIPISAIKQSALTSKQTISTRPIQQQQVVTISQIMRKFPTKQSQIKTQVYHKHEGLRDSEINKYVVEVFSHLNLQTRKSLNSNMHTNNNNITNTTTNTINSYSNSSKYIIPNPKNKQYLMQMPQTCRSLVKIEQPGSEFNELEQQTPRLKGTVQSQSQQQNKIRKSNQIKSNNDNYNLQVIQSQLNQDINNCSNNRPKPTPSQNKNKRVVKNQFNFQSIKDAPQSFYQQNYSTVNLNQPGHSVVTNNIQNGSRRASKQIKTFKIQNIQEKKQSDFGGCCGFGIVDKISFHSKDV